MSKPIREKNSAGFEHLAEGSFLLQIQSLYFEIGIQPGIAAV